MRGRKKKTKLCDKVSVEEDRISQLPDHLRSEILTHLSTKDVVKTSVLSTRWRNLWKCVPELNLWPRPFSSDVNRFVSFSEKFFDPHKESCIRKLKLTIDRFPDDNSFLNRWIDAVITRKIQHLHLNFYNYLNDDSIDKIPPLSIFTCQTLVHLQLCGAVLVNAEFVSLPCLKIIYLEETRCPNQATLEKLISSPPLLEDLTLISSSSSIAKVLQVRSQTLKRIYINESAKVVIDAPLLQCFRTVIDLTKNFEIINLGFSTKLDIIVLHGYETYSTSLIHAILTDISMVKNLVISHDFWKDIFLYSKSGPVLQFCYLSHLDTSFYITNLEMLLTLLESCPKLESFILELVKDPSMSWKKKKEPKVIFSTVPECLVSSLKLVKLKRSIPWNEGEIELLRYLLKNAAILEKLKLHVYYTKKAECDFLKELLTMPRISKACEVHCSFVPKW